MKNNRTNIRKTIRGKKRNNSRKIKGGVRSTRSVRSSDSDTRGSNLRNELVQLCKHNKWDEYNDLTKEIINDYLRGDKSFFIHLNRNYFNNKKYKKEGFKLTTKLCLEKALTRFQEEAIPESMPFLYDVMKLTGRA